MSSSLLACYLPCMLASFFASYLSCWHPHLFASLLTRKINFHANRLFLHSYLWIYIIFVNGCKILWYSSWNLIFILSHSFWSCFTDDSLPFLSNHNIKWYKTRTSFFEILVVVWERNSKVINNYDVGIKRWVYLCTCCFRECDE